MLIQSIQNKINDFTQKSLVRDTLWLLSARLFTLVMQAAYFTIVTRVLGSENFGSFTGVTAMAALVYPFAALGNEHLLIQYVSRDRSCFRTYWGNALVVILYTSLVLTFILLLLSPLFMPKSVSSVEIFLILLADLTCLAIFELCSKCFLAVGLVKNSAKLQTVYICAKLMAAIFLAVLFDEASTLTWAILYLLSTLLVAIGSVTIVNFLIGFPRPVLSKLKGQIGQGVYFSISASAQNVNSYADQTMLLSMSSKQDTGIYAAAYRFIEFGYTPIYVTLAATYPRFFKQGASGIGATFAFARSLLPAGIAYGAIVVISYQVFAPLLPMILGSEYTEAIDALRWLAPLPFIAIFQLLAADTLTGAGLQKVRSIIQAGSAFLNIGLNLWLIPRYSWKGAAWATLTSDSLRAVFLWVFVLFLIRKYSDRQVIKNRD
jgi:O-antigen/teichoic acid export membrane protein